MIQDRQTIKAKSAAMSAIMRNPKLSRVISDAWVAPPGSTMNQKAKNVLKSLHTANSNYLYAQDGRGGTSDFSYNPTAYPNSFIGPLPQDASRTAPTAPAAPAPAQSDFSIASAPAPKPTSYQIVQGVDSYLPSNSPLVTGGATPKPEEKKRAWYLDPIYSYNKLMKQGVADPIEAWTRQQAAGFKESLSKKYEAIQPNTMAGLWLKEVGSTAGSWLSTGLGYADTANSWSQKKTYQAVDLIAKIPNAISATGAWLLSDPAENKKITDFMKDQPTLVSLLQTSTPEIEEAIKQKAAVQEAVQNGEMADPGIEWTQEEADRYYLQLMDRKFTPRGDYWGGATSAKDITDEMMREEVKRKTGLYPTEIKQTVSDDGSKTDEELSLIADLMGTNSLDSWYNALDPSMKDYYKIAYENAKSGRGRAGFLREAIGDTEFMEALGVPKSVVDMLPKSGLLAEHLLDLKESVKKQYGLDELLNKVRTMEEQGYTVEEDMKAYIRGKDEYLAQIEKLTEDAETKYANMDTSNPYVDSRMKNYLNYLNIIHGRQNQRYIDYLNSSYDRFNSRLDQLNRRYEVAFKQAEEEYNDLSVISREAYESIKGQLDRVYDLVEQESGTYETMTEDAIARLQAAANLKKTTLDNQMKQLDIDNYGQKELSSPKWSDYDSMIFAEKDKDGLITLGVMNPFQAGQLATQSNLDKDVAVNRQLIWLQSYLQQEIAAGNLEDSVKGAYTDITDAYYETKELIDSIGENYSELSGGEKILFDYFKENVESIYDLGINKIESTVKTSLRDSFAAKPLFANDVREAIKDLTGIGIFNREAKDQESFVDKYSESLGASVASTLFKSYWAARASGLKNDEVFLYNDQPIHEITNNNIVSSVISNLMYQNLLN